MRLLKHFTHFLSKNNYCPICRKKTAYESFPPFRKHKDVIKVDCKRCGVAIYTRESLQIIKELEKNEYLMFTNNFKSHLGSDISFFQQDAFPFVFFAPDPDYEIEESHIQLGWVDRPLQGFPSQLHRYLDFLICERNEWKNRLLLNTQIKPIANLTVDKAFSIPATCRAMYISVTAINAKENVSLDEKEYHVIVKRPDGLIFPCLVKCAYVAHPHTKEKTLRVMFEKSIDQKHVEQGCTLTLYDSNHFKLPYSFWGSYETRFMKA
jgi:hypothetical protein